jgi:hypothetical protein
MNPPSVFCISWSSWLRFGIASTNCDAIVEVLEPSGDKLESLQYALVEGLLDGAPTFGRNVHPAKDIKLLDILKPLSNITVQRGRARAKC